MTVIERGGTLYGRVALTLDAPEPTGIVPVGIDLNETNALVAVAVVNPAYTSQKCSRCGLLGTRRRHLFLCSHCGYTAHADVNGATNVRNRFVQLRLDAAPSVAAEALPLAGEGKPRAL